MGMKAASRLSLGEGSTPLVHAPRLSEELGLDVHLKVEGANPTGSFKDRGMVIAVERAVESGAHTVVCASTGNTAASAAAYAARAGLRAVVLTPSGGTASAKRAQATAAGARVIEIRGSFDDALRLAFEVCRLDGFVLVNSASPDRNRIDGQKLVAGEIVEQLGSVPDVVALPFGGGGNVSAVSLGLSELGAAPALVVGEAAERPTTWATAIRIAEPAHAEEVGGLVASGQLRIVTLAEDEIAHWWRKLSAEEGVFCEPASAAGVAALSRVDLSAWQTAVAIVTGHGLKDTGSVDQSSSATVDATVDAILEVLA
jgi:threonine synthase